MRTSPLTISKSLASHHHVVNLPTDSAFILEEGGDGIASQSVDYTERNQRKQRHTSVDPMLVPTVEAELL